MDLVRFVPPAQVQELLAAPHGVARHPVLAQEIESVVLVARIGSRLALEGCPADGEDECDCRGVTSEGGDVRFSPPLDQLHKSLGAARIILPHGDLAPPSESLGLPLKKLGEQLAGAVAVGNDLGRGVGEIPAQPVRCGGSVRRVLLPKLAVYTSTVSGSSTTM